jgi:urease accessory protein
MDTPSRVPARPEPLAHGWVAAFLQAGDSAYPTGAYAHSFGLEGLCAGGHPRDLEGLRAFLLGQLLPQLEACDLPVAAAVWRIAAEEADWSAVGQWCRMGAALRGTREAREACEAIGRQRAELAARLHGGACATFVEQARAEAWPIPSFVAAAVEGSALGVPLEAVLIGLVYSAVSGVIAAAVKLLRLGQNACQLLLREVLAQAPECLRCALARPEEDLGSFNPWWDIASSRHETAEFRLFIS